MEHRSNSNGLETFLEHWGLLITAVIAVVASQLLLFVMGLRGVRWIWGFVAGLTLLFAGGGLIAYAKLTVYKSGKFLTLGLNSVPEHLRGHYRAGVGECCCSGSSCLCVSWSRNNDTGQQSAPPNAASPTP
jgi:hypothetical protein